MKNVKSVFLVMMACFFALPLSVMAGAMEDITPDGNFIVEIAGDQVIVRTSFAETDKDGRIKYANPKSSTPFLTKGGEVFRGELVVGEKGAKGETIKYRTDAKIPPGGKGEVVFIFETGDNQMPWADSFAHFRAHKKGNRKHVLCYTYKLGEANYVILGENDKPVDWFVAWGIKKDGSGEIVVYSLKDYFSSENSNIETTRDYYTRIGVIKEGASHSLYDIIGGQIK